MRLCSDTEIRPDKELILNKNMNELIYLMNKDKKNLDDKQFDKINNSFEYMYDYLIEKMRNEYKSLKNSCEKIFNCKEKFLQMEYENKIQVINSIIDMIENRCVNLKILGLSSAEGRMNGKNLNTERLLNMTFIDKSVTGMYESRFKVDGMENSSSK